MPLPKAQRLHAAGQSSGDTSRRTAVFAGLGAAGKYAGNLARDFRVMAYRNQRLIRPYSLEVPLKNADGVVDPSVTTSIDILLPHESFAWLASRGPAHFESRLCPGGWDSVSEWWKARREEPWYDQHPATQLLNSDVKMLPMQLYGDDAEMHKGNSALVLTYSSPLCSMPSWHSKMLIAVVPLRLCGPETLETIYACVRWSFDVLLGRRWPEHDCWGNVWQDWRQHRAGEFLNPDMQCGAAVVRLLGDWKWLKESLGLTRYWKTRFICHLCCAVATIDKRGHGADMLYTDFGDEAGWRPTRMTHTQFLALFAACMFLPALLQLAGFHVSMAHPDVMHSFHLGFVGFAISSELMVLCSRGHFGHFDGERLLRLKQALTVAFGRFRRHCRAHQIEHSQQPFKPGVIGCSEAGTFPDWHGKAANAKAVCYWLTVEMGEAAPPAERALFGALTDVLRVLHRRPRVRLGRVERRDFYASGSAALRIYAVLNADAVSNAEALWPLRPKLHMVQHMLLEVRRTGNIPEWSFADEDFNGRVIRCEWTKGWSSTLPRRICIKWALAKFRQTRD